MYMCTYVRTYVESGFTTTCLCVASGLCRCMCVAGRSRCTCVAGRNRCTSVAGRSRCTSVAGGVGVRV